MNFSSRKRVLLLAGLGSAVLLGGLRLWWQFVPRGVNDNPMAFLYSGAKFTEVSPDGKTIVRVVISYSGGRNGAHRLWVVRDSHLGQRAIWCGYAATDLQKPAMQWMDDRHLSISCLGESPTGSEQWVVVDIER